MQHVHSHIDFSILNICATHTSTSGCAYCTCVPHVHPHVDLYNTHVCHTCNHTRISKSMGAVQNSDYSHVTHFRRALYEACHAPMSCRCRMSCRRSVTHFRRASNETVTAAAQIYFRR